MDNMKRLFLLILLVIAAVFFIRVRQSHSPRRPEATPSNETRRELERARRDLHRALARSRQEANRAAAKTRAEARQALHEAKAALHEAHQEVTDSLREAAAEIREAVDGIPVPIVPGTCVVEAVAEPPAAPEAFAELGDGAPHPPAPPVAPGFPGLAEGQPSRLPQVPAPPGPPAQQLPTHRTAQETRIVPGLISITPERSREEARKELQSLVTDWLEAAGVPRTWTPPAHLIDAMVLDGTKVDTVVKDDDPVYKDHETLYVAKLKVDVSPERRATFVRTYQHQLVLKRMGFLGAGLAFVLTCLAAVSGYIRTDEVTKGYYTNRLRLLAAVGVGAAAVAILRMVA